MVLGTHIYNPSIMEAQGCGLSVSLGNTAGSKPVPFKKKTKEINIKILNVKV